MYTVKRTNEYLEHHGILGQKWGKKNGPPYPLDQSDRSPKEQRLATDWFKLAPNDFEFHVCDFANLDLIMDVVNEMYK